MKKLISSILLIILVSTAGWAQSAPKDEAIPIWKLQDLKDAISKAEKPTIINFWATFCKPCIAEIPYFLELTEKYDSAGVQLILVSLDMKDAYNRIAPFAKKRNFNAPIAWLDETNADLFCPAVDESWSGSIPATLLINPTTGYRQFFEEEMSREKLEGEIVKMLSDK